MTYSTDFPADKLLDRLGPEVGRLVLLRRFSHSDAVRYSDGRFDDERLARYVDIVFVEDPVSEEYIVRPELDGVLLHAMEAARSTAPRELARLLITTQVGEEVLEPDELLRWMVRRRLDPLTQATVGGMAAFAAREIAPTIEMLLDTAEAGLTTSTALLPYTRPVRRWRIVTSSHPDQDVFTEQALDVFTNLGRILEFRPRRMRSVIFLADGVLPEHFRMTRPVRARDTLQLEMKPMPMVALGQSLQTPQLTSAGPGETLRSDVPLSESTIQLFKLVMSDRGQASITDRIRIKVSEEQIERAASVSISDTTTIGDTAYVHLGTLPRSVGSALRREVLVDGEPMTWGGGQVISLYVQEMTRLLADLAGRTLETTGISASDWYRVERSVREPWRFISTKRTYVHFGVAEVNWTSLLSDEGLVHGRDLWPFGGASLSRVVVEGFRFGSDDGYNVDVQCEDTNAIRSASIDSVTRPADIVALERPSRVRVYLAWPDAAYRTVMMVALFCALVLIAIGAQGKRGGLDYADINITLSVVSLVTGPVVAYLTASQFDRTGGGRLPYLKQTWRCATMVILTAVLSLTTLLTAGSSDVRLVLAALDIAAGGYFALAVAVSIFLRLRRSWAMRDHIAAAARLGSTGRSG